MKHQIVYTNKFLKDVRKYSKSGIDFKGRLGEVIESLGSRAPLPEKFKDHKLSGPWEGYRECHILFDLLLVYKPYRNYVELVTLGTHKELF